MGRRLRTGRPCDSFAKAVGGLGGSFTRLAGATAVGASVKRARTLVVSLCLLALIVSSSGQASDQERLSSLRVFNRVVLLVKEQYVEPTRIRPREMLLAALDAVEKSVPEVLVQETSAHELMVSVGSERRSFPVDDVTSLWELSFKLRDVFRFIETRISADVDKKEVEYAAVNGMLSKLDPHSVLLEPRFSQEMSLSTKGEFGGLGIVISIRDAALTVISPIDGTPADRAGVKSGDKIVKIGEESTVNMGLDEAVERLRGKPGTPVTVWILRKASEEPKRLEIVRAVIKVESVSHQRLDDALGYVKIKQFQGHTADDVHAAVQQMQKQGPLKGLILDLRNNPGGLLDQAAEVSNLFLRDGVLVITQEGQGPNARKELTADAKLARIDLPVVVLVNGGSASASEIVAGALRNRGRGLIVGDQTFGKGSIQQLYGFPDSSSLKLTVGQYLTPGDESIQSVGITPDVQLNAVVADNKDALNVFADVHTREVDLERHLDDAHIKRSSAAYQFSYLAETVDSDELERREANAKFQDDFETRLCRRLLAQAASTSRDEMLKGVKPVIDAVSAEEDRRVDEALTKLGLSWQGGPRSGNAKLQASVVSAVVGKAGSDLHVTLEAKNTGNAPLHRVRGVSDATLGYLADREFLFGKLGPGEARQWTVDVKVPKDLQGRRDLMRVTFADDSGELAKLDVPVVIDGLPRPRFSYALFIDDGKTGNGDGLLQVGENVELVVSIRNTGPGDAAEPTALLKNLGGAEAFIETGRQKLEPLKSGASGLARFAFKVQGDLRADKGVAPQKVDLRLQVFDSVMGDFLVEKLSFPIKAQAAQSLRKKGVVEATASTPILAAADAGSAVVARAEAGARLDAVAEVNGFVRVKLGGGNTFGYVASAGVGPARGKPVVGADGEPRGLSRVYGRDPPRIIFADAGDNVVTDGDTYEVIARIEDDGPVYDAFVFVGDQKVHYQLLGTKGPTAGVVKHTAKLKPGVNVITVVAREDDEFAQREVLTVYSKKGDPLADQKTAH